MRAACLVLAGAVTLNGPPETRDLRQQQQQPVPEVKELRVAVSVGASGNLGLEPAVAPEAKPEAQPAEVLPMGGLATATTTEAAPAEAQDPGDDFISAVLSGPGEVLKLSETEANGTAPTELAHLEKDGSWGTEEAHARGAASVNRTNGTNASAPMSGSMSAFHDMVTSSLLRIKSLATSMLSITPKVAESPTSLVQAQQEVQSEAELGSLEGVTTHGQRRSLSEVQTKQRDLLWDSLSSGMSLGTSHDMGPSRVPALLELQHQFLGPSVLSWRVALIPVVVLGVTSLVAHTVQAKE